MAFERLNPNITKHFVSISEAQIFKTLSITEAERKKADAYKKKV